MIFHIKKIGKNNQKINLKSEMKRKFIHSLAIVYIFIWVFLSRFFEGETVLMLFLGWLLFLIIGEYFRVEQNNKLFSKLGLWRKKEEDRFGGHIFMFLGFFIVLAVFDFKIAITAILMAIFGDLSSALIGIKFGRVWFSKDRALEGILAQFFVDLVVGFLILGFNSWTIILVMALVATTVETLTRKLDDNFVVPIFSGFAGQFAFYILYGINPYF
jgi:dolichol kinase